MKATQFVVDNKKIAAISKKYGLIFIVLFGSRARNQKRTAESDTDIAVLTKNEPDYTLFGELFSELSDLFPHENVDLRFLNGADLLFRFNVVKDGILLYGRESEYRNYTLSSIKMYYDDLRKYEPFLNKLLENNQKKLEANL